MNIEKLIQNFEKRNIRAYFAKNASEANEIAVGIAEETRATLSKERNELSVAWGGSVTLDTIGIKQLCTERGYNVINPYALPLKEQAAAKKQAVISDVFLTSSNAVCETGELVNIDGNGNRVAALVYGAQRVIVIAGKNKITPDIKSAYKRIKETACPKNAARLSRNTPCAKSGVCASCLISGETICAHTVITRFSSVKDRICVIIIDEELGF